MGEKHSESCSCPMCEHELTDGCFEASFCKPCGSVPMLCAACGHRFTVKADRCPKCGSKNIHAEKKRP